MTGARWVERLTIEGAAVALAIAQRYQVPEIVARVLAGRGVGIDEVPQFLNPTVRALMPDPLVLTGMDSAANLIADAIISGERIAIFGDYDVDGASSSALLARFLRELGMDPEIYIPDRLFEGYGPNVEAVKQLVAKGAELIVRTTPRRILLAASGIRPSRVNDARIRTAGMPRTCGRALAPAGEPQIVAVRTPPSARRAAPFVADDSGLAR